ncbi:MAG: GAF domain-containing protein, partial [Dehalococcoidia bacterium]
MNVHVVTPVIATVAYIPLLVIVLMNRPWQSRQRLFFLFLVPAILWSATDIFFRSSLFMQHKLLLVQIVLFFAVWMIIQYRYFLQSFYKTDVARKPFAYIILATFSGLLALGYVPQDITVTADNIHVNYGPWVIAIAAIILAFTTKDIYNLIHKLKISDNVEERNQIIYLFVGLACLAVFGFITFQFSAEGYPVGHIGNFLNACILTYAVLTYRLLDIRVVFRQAVVNVVLYGSGIGIVLLVFWLAYRFIGFQLSLTSLLVTIALGVPAILVLAHKLGAPWRTKIEEAFIGERYHYRKLLSQFITTIQNVSSMEQFGSDFVSLLSQSIGCQRACLLLPEAQEKAFVPRSTYPPVQDNPVRELRLRSDNPIVEWLQQEKVLLPARNISIYPEFKSIWQEERESIRLAGVRVFVPLVNMDELVGILAIGERRDEKPYTVEDFDLLNSIGAQVAASMEKEYIY